MHTLKRRSYRYIEKELEPDGPSKSTIQRWVKQHPFGSLLERREQRGRKSQLHADGFRQLVEDAINKNPFYISYIQRVHGIRVDVTAPTMSLWRKKLNFTRKLSVSATVDNERVAAQRKAFSDQMVLNDDWSSVISIDETAVYTKSKQPVGFSRRGKRIRISYTGGACKRLTFLLAISRTGIVGYTIINGACNANLYAEFITSLDAPTGSRLLMDNASIHTCRTVATAVVAKGFRSMFLPPYTPQWQPIEYAFSQFKRSYRSLANDKEGDHFRDISHEEKIMGCIAFLEHDRAVDDGELFGQTFDHCIRLATANLLFDADPVTNIQLHHT
jgi:transposase